MNSASTQRNHRLELILCFILLVLLVIVFILQTRRSEMADDAFITYRYVANLVKGYGLVYNPGEPVLGTTAPGYALLLALPAKIFGVDTLPAISRIMNAIALIITCVSIGGITWRITGQRFLSVVMGGMVLIAPYTMWAAAYGMELPFFLMFIALGLWLYMLDYRRTAAVLIGLLISFRPEGIFIIGLHGLTILYTGYRSRNWREMFFQGVLLVLPGIVYVIALMALYGHPLPQSVYAKRSGIYVLTVQQTTQWIMDNGARFVKLFIPDLSEDIVPIITLVEFVLAVLGSIWLAKRHTVLWIVPWIAVAIEVFYSQAATLLFSWYFGNFELPEVLALITGMAAVFAFITNRLIRNTDLRARAYRIVMIVVLTAMCAMMFTANDWAIILQPNSNYPPVMGREEVYWQIANIIRPKLPAGTTIAMTEIGVLGFYLPDVYVLDTAGLVSPQAVPYFPLPPEERAGDFTGAVPKKLIRDFMPDLVITLEIFARRNILDDDWFKSNYTEVMDWRGDWLKYTFGSAALFVHSRNDFEPGMSLMQN